MTLDDERFDDMGGTYRCDSMLRVIPMASDYLAVDANFWAVKEIRPDSRSGLTQMGGFPGLESSDGEGYVESSCLCGCGWVRACMATLVHPCRVKSFREAVASAVMDVLGEVLANKD